MLAFPFRLGRGGRPLKFGTTLGSVFWAQPLAMTRDIWHLAPSGKKTGKPGTYVRREKQPWPPSPQPPKLPTFPAASVRGEAKGGLWETGLAGEEEGERFCCEVMVGKPPLALTQPLP